MSYEGREQVLCENGHLSEYDCYDWEFNHPMAKWECPICKAKAAWTGGVGETNGCENEFGDVYGMDENGKHYVQPGMYPGEIDWDKHVKEPQLTETCPHCNQTRITRHVTYDIPEGIGRKTGNGHNKKD